MRHVFTLLFALAMVVAGCGGSSDNSSSLPTAPSSSATPSLADLAGTWNGLIPGSGFAAGLRWTAATNGTNLSGTVLFGEVAVIDVGGVRDDPRNGVGTMTVSFTGTGNQVTIAMNFAARAGNQGPGGAFGGAGLPNCAMTGSGTGNATPTVISGNITLSWSAECGTGGPVSNRGGQLSMRKQ